MGQAGPIKHADIVGDSGAIINGQGIQFTEPGVKVLLRGPSGVVLSNGKLHQLNKRSVNEFGDVVGDSGAIIDGEAIQFLEPGVTIASRGPSGVVFSNGQVLQLKGRKKRSAGDVVGDSGAIIDGELIQFTEPGVTVASRGPSGVVFSNGQLLQLKGRKKRSAGDVVGDSGAIIDGELIQF